VVIRGITFETESADLSGASYAAVTNLGDLLNRYPALKVAVVGHTDNTGPFEFNIDLSERRRRRSPRPCRPTSTSRPSASPRSASAPSPRSTPTRRTTAAARTAASSW
jgi:hypothetical protein